MAPLEPYRGEDGAWDWRIIMLLQALLSGKTGEALVIGLIIVILIAIVAINAYFLHLLAEYLWNTYKDKAWGSTREARTLQGILLASVGVWLVSFMLFKGGNINDGLYVNIVGLTVLMFCLGVTGIGERSATKLLPPGQVKTNRSKLKDFLRPKKKEAKP